MIISDNRVAKSKWFPIPDDPDDASIEVTVLMPGDNTKIDSKVQKLIATQNGGNELSFDIALSGQLHAMAALTGWENVYLTPEDRAAKRCAPFTAINKEKALNEDEVLKGFVLECLGSLTQEYLAAKDAARKNSSPSVNG